MDCRQNQENLSAYLDGELPPAEREALRRHLDECAACRQLAAELRSVAALLHGAARRPAPADLADEVQSRLEREMLLTAGPEEPEHAARMDRRLAHERPVWWPRVAAVAACLALVLAIAALWPTPKHEAASLAPQSPPKPELAMTLPSRAPGVEKATAEKLELRRDEQSALAASTLEMQTEAGAAGAPRASDVAYVGGAKEDKDSKYKWTGAPAAAEQVKRGFGGGSGLTENVLVLAADTDLATATREMDDVLAQAGIHNLTQSPGGPAEQWSAKPAAAKAARRLGEQPTDKVVYTGTLNTVELSNLNSAVAQNGKLTVVPHSNGVFSQAPQMQNTFRLRNNDQLQSGAASNAAKPSGGTNAFYGYQATGGTVLADASGGSDRQAGSTDKAERAKDELKKQGAAAADVQRVVIELQVRRPQLPAAPQPAAAPASAE